MKSDDLTVVIPTRGRPHILDRALEGLRAQTAPGFELVVVLDGDDQPIPDISDASVLVQPHRGPGAARNRGVAATQRPLLLFLGDDMIADRHLVERHLDAHERHPDVTTGVLGAVDWHPEVERNPLLMWMDRNSLQFDAAGLTAPDVEAGWARFTTANVSLRRELFEQAGGFDEDFFFLYEDIEFGWRLGQEGLQLFFEPRARCGHLHSYDLQGFRNRMSAVGRSERLMAAKHEWFEPWFRPRVLDAMQRPRPMQFWPKVVDRIPPSARHLRSLAEDATTRWYLQQAAPAFFENWEATQDLEELKEYLGDAFDESKLYRHKELVDAEHESAENDLAFYRTSEAYLYELTQFGFWQIKTPYLIDMLQLAPPPCRVLDYGCGIGTDGLRMAGLGYSVSFADFDNPSTRYLRWRLERRQLDLPVYDVEAEVPGDHDVVFCFDVIEHVDDPWGFLHRLEQLGRIVVVNLLEPEPEEEHNDLHRPLPIGRMLDHAARRGLLRYRVYHQGRSHLVAFRGLASSDRPSPVHSRTERYLGRVLSRLEGLP